MIRYIIFDTETTGLDPLSGDRIIEIGCVEMVNKVLTGNEYHQFINPECQISQETINITHITNEMVADKPIFKDIANDFLSFIENDDSKFEKTILVAHNASFDLKFLNFELKKINHQGMSKFEVIDTIDLARRKFPGQRASLDAICERFGISLEERKKEGHGALLDSKILADVFVKLTEDTDINKIKDDNIDFIGIKKGTLRESRQIYKLTEQELGEHKKLLQDLGIKE